MTDLFKKFNNNINLQLQEDRLNFIKANGAISVFRGKFRYMKQNTSWWEYSQFLKLSTLMSTFRNTFIDFEVDYFKIRFEDILTIEIPFWILDPFDETE